MYFSVIIVVIGFFFAFIFPMLKTEVSEVELATVQVYERSEGHGWMNKDLELNTINNPTRLKLTAVLLPGTAYLEKIARFKVKVTGQEGVVREQPVQISVGRYIEPKDGFLRVSTYISEFSVAQSGSYTINVSMEEIPDFSLSAVSVASVTGLAVPDTSLRIHGIFAFAFGMFLSIRGMIRKRRQKSDVPETTPPKTETPKPVEKPEKKKIKWGRNADQD